MKVDAQSWLWLNITESEVNINCCDKSNYRKWSNMRHAILLSLFALAGCQYPQKRIGIIHDYMFQNALQLCEAHGGLHYIVTDTTITAKSSERHGSDDYPCEDPYLVRCQDQTLIKQDTGAAWCFISERQVRESLEGK